MFKNHYKGKFIAIEGLSGSGATTQAYNLKNYFRSKKTLITKEPTNDIIGGIIRAALKKDWKISSPHALQLLFTADRANHLNNEIIPSLEKGINVITDRYFLSSIAYGSVEINDKEWLCNINDQFILPDLTILIKISSKTCMERIKNDDLGIKLFDKQKNLEKVWEAYESIAKKYPNVVIIDGEKPKGEVFENILKEASNIIK
jgi:dTMP kinase